MNDNAPDKCLPDQRKRLVVLISGSGSNLQSIIDNCASGEINAEICAVFANRPDAYGLKRADYAGIPGIIIEHKRFDSREAFDCELVKQIDRYQPDLVILAGFMRILSDAFVKHYAGRLFNIHPSLLPAYPGLNTHQRAIDAGDDYGGATVHFVTTELDGGPPVIQAREPIKPGESAESLAAKVLKHEHRIYPLAVKWFCQNRLQLRGDKVLLDGNPVQKNGVAYWETCEPV